MSNPTDIHAPTPEFSEFLARDIVRTLRHDARFAPSARAVRARRLGLVMASAAGTVIVLAIGLVSGISTGYASARVESDRQRDAVAANTMGATSRLAALRLELAHVRSDLARRATGERAVPQASLRAAEAELRAMEASAERIERDLTESRVSTVPPSPSVSRSIPMKRALAVTCSALALGAQPAQ